jgi:hypothetical protein
MSKKTGVTVKDVAADKFIAAYAELLKRSGKVLFKSETRMLTDKFIPAR